MSYKQIPAGQVLQYLKDNYEGKLVQDSRSAAGNWLNFTLEHIDKGTATISLEVKEDMTNPYGNIHGGMMALVMDEVIGWGVVSLDTDNYYTSLNLNVDFLYAIKMGERLKATSKVVRAGKKIIHVECHVYDMQDRILGKASSNLIVTGMRPKEGDYKVAN
ncbi:MAG: PaaI family thioesterase [Chitinophagaceae bacterium]|nr:PaaI family thioesterase [Chitinophagaceae bacterium]MCB9047114.1 PaaI family thioesterase [Chitinophagales bacterium]